MMKSFINMNSGLRTYLILFGFFLFDGAFAATIKQIQNVPPVPGLPENTDPTLPTTKASTEPEPPKLSNSYLPAVMHALAYYVDLLQYEHLDTTTIEPPFTLSTDKNNNTESSPSTYLLPVSTTIKTTTVNTKPTTSPLHVEQTTVPHKPGYYAPEKPSLQTEPEAIALKPVENNYNPSATTMKPQLGSLPLLSISNSEFFNWFLQMKVVELPKISANDLEFLQPLPAALFQDIQNERYEQPALLDVDNVSEFLKAYDDYYGRNQPLTGRKKLPPTKPYVQMLMLYDLLKREAKKLMLNKFEGYSHEMLIELNETARGSAERQLYTLMSRMIERKDVDKPDIKVRVKSIMDDLVNPYSITAKSLRYLPPLEFLL